MNRDVFFITRERDDLPEAPPWDLVLKVDAILRAEGYVLRFDRESSYIFGKIIAGVKKDGITHYTSTVRLLESVLPDGAPQEESLDLLHSMVRTIAPKKELLLIDPYLFPERADADYIPFLKKLFGPTFKKITRLDIITLAKHSKPVRADFLAMVASFNRGIVVSIRHAKVFHDRIWIADKKQGLFVGTSLNGIGIRYAIADYLRKQDVKDIVARAAAIPIANAKKGDAARVASPFFSRAGAP